MHGRHLCQTRSVPRQVATHLRSIGLADVEPVRNELVDTVMIKDSDGNSIAFAVPHSDALAH